MVKHARANYQRPGLSYEVGDARDVVFPAGSVQLVSCSSTGHHLTSYGSPRFDTKHVLKSFDAFATQLADGGLFVHRDFVIPEGPRNVVLELPTGDGKQQGTQEELSTAAFFELFADRFRSSQHPDRGVPFHRLGDAKDGWRRYVLTQRDATEFLLRKDYRKTFEAEILEEYLYGKREFIEDALTERGFRIVLSIPVYNPWILQNRFEGKYRWFDSFGNLLPHPPTNYIVVAEKTPKGQGVRIAPSAVQPKKEPAFLHQIVYRDKITGALFDLISRPNRTIDLLPYAFDKGRLYVYARQGFPRPILNARGDSPNLTDTRFAGYFVEPLSFLEKGTEPRFVEIVQQLAKRGGLQPVDSSSELLTPWIFYPSPGTTDERVEKYRVEVGLNHQLNSPEQNYSGFSTTGLVRAFDAEQILRFAGVGAHLDDRLELGVYDLLLERGLPIPKWIGAKITANTSAAIDLPWVPFGEALRPGTARRFDLTEFPFGSFLAVQSMDFDETDSDGKLLTKSSREFAFPKNTSSNLASALPFTFVGDRVAVAIESRHFASLQRHEGISSAGVCPAWWLPKTVKNVPEAVSFVRKRLAEWTQDTPLVFSTLGGAYAPSPGVTPELVYPLAVQFEARDFAKLQFLFVDLDDLVKNRRQIRDGHLAISVLRLAHAFGRLGPKNSN